MSERTRTDQDQVRQVPAAQRGRPGPIHEALYSQIMADVLELVQEYAPTTGTVTGMDGGKVLVEVDDESEPRTVGIPRQKGVRYEPGDRVGLQRTRGSARDQYHVTGTTSTKAGRDPAVGNEDLYDDAVESRHIKRGSVGKDQIAPQAVGSNEVEDKSLPLDKLNQNAQQTINGKAEKNHSHNEYADKQHTHNYANKDHTHNYAGNNHSHSEYAAKSHGHAISDISGLQKKLDDLEKLAKRGGGGEG